MKKPKYLSEPLERTKEAQWLRSHVCVPPQLPPSFVKWYNDVKKNQEKKEEA